MFETFCLRLAAGLVLALLILPRGVVNPRFYRIHLLIVLGLTVAAGMASGERGDAAGLPEDPFWLTLGLALGTILVTFWCWCLKDAPGAGAGLAASGGLLVTAAMVLPLGSGGHPAWTLVDHAGAALLLGVATTAMLMGHWYLISPTMSLQPLLRLLLALFAAVAFRMLTAGGQLAWAFSHTGFDQVTWWWLGLHWGAGLVGPLVLGWMAWQAARIRSTQSATGILYVVVILSFIGELTSQLLQGHLASVGRSA